MAESPTTRSLKALRADGWLCEVTERWNPHAQIRQDLFGFVDIIALKGGVTLAVQTTTGSNASKRVIKIAESPHIAAVRAAGWSVHVHAWRKLASGRWELRTVDVS